MSDLSLELVAAVAANGVIGRDGQLPWHLPDDLRHFKTLTLGHPVIMGRRTFASINRPLPGRRNLVVSTTLNPAAAPGVEIVRSLADAINLVVTVRGPVFIVGGAALYAAALDSPAPHRADRMHLTELAADFAGDTYFPNWDRTQWQVTRAVPHPADERHAVAFRICTYQRIRN